MGIDVVDPRRVGRGGLRPFDLQLGHRQRGVENFLLGWPDAAQQEDEQAQTEGVRPDPESNR